MRLSMLVTLSVATVLNWTARVSAQARPAGKSASPVSRLGARPAGSVYGVQNTGVSPYYQNALRIGVPIAASSGAQPIGSGVVSAESVGSVVGTAPVLPRPINSQPDSVFRSQGYARFLAPSGFSSLEGFRNPDNSIDYFNTGNSNYLYGKAKADGSQDLFNPSNGVWLWGIKNSGGTVDYYNPHNGQFIWDTNRGSRSPVPPP